MSFQVTPGWLPYHPSPSVPAFALPPGAVDAHCHVFGPGAEFPYAPERKYTPCDASKHQLFALRDHLGFDKNVIVQATCHGDRQPRARRRTPGRRTTGRAVWQRWTAASPTPNCARCTRLACAAHGSISSSGSWTSRRGTCCSRSPIASHPLGWHVVVYFEAADLPELWDFFTALPTTVVVDHMGRPDVRKPVDGPEFELFVRMMREHETIWSKVSCPERLSVSGPPARDGERNAYRDVVPFARRLVETFPDRVLWGTDWPHPNLKDHMPDDGLLVDFIPHIARTPELQHRLLVDNPMRLYWR